MLTFRFSYFLSLRFRVTLDFMHFILSLIGCHISSCFRTIQLWHFHWACLMFLFTKWMANMRLFFFCWSICMQFAWKSHAVNFWIEISYDVDKSRRTPSYKINTIEMLTENVKRTDFIQVHYFFLFNNDKYRKHACGIGADKHWVKLTKYRCEWKSYAFISDRCVRYIEQDHRHTKSSSQMVFCVNLMEI